MRFIIILISTIFCQNIFSETLTCSDFADYEQEGFNSYYIAKMRNPGASESMIFVNYEREADAAYFAEIAVIDAASKVVGFEKPYLMLASSTNKFLVKKYSNIMGFAHANQFLNGINKKDLSLFLSELRVATVKNCENVVRSQESRNSFESLMMFLIKQNQKSNYKEL